jgi:Integrase core domain
VERFHLTLRRELLDDARPFESILAAQAALDDWVRDYNATRPHQSLETRAPVAPAERFEPVAVEERELLPLWLPASFRAPPDPQPTEAAERAVDAGAEQRPVDGGRSSSSALFRPRGLSGRWPVLARSRPGRADGPVLGGR